jgi:hypothetical protein
LKNLFVFLSLIILLLYSCSKDDSNPVDPNSSNYSLQFNGVNNYVEIPFTERHDLFKDFSIESWVKFDSIAVGTIISKVTQANSLDTLSSYSVYFDKNYPNKVVFSTMIGWRYNPDLSSTELEHKAVSSIALSPKQWHHIVVVYKELDYSKMIFIDGVNSYSEKNTGDVTYFRRSLYVGSQKTSADKIISPYKGNIDEIRIWEKALSQEEIIYNKNHLLADDENGLVGLYHFNEGTRSIATDNSPTKVNGTIKGASWANGF